MHLHQPAHYVRMALLAATMIMPILPALSSPLLGQEGSIIAVQENGRKIYVNNEAPAKPAASARPRSGRHSVLVYWSNTEHRWKPVPAPSRAAMRAARSAADEVKSYIAAQPRTSETSPALANPNYSTVARGYRVSAAEIDTAIEQAASKYGVDANLVRAVIKVESNFNPNAVSNKGAMGLMQLMPHTARGLSVKNPFDPQQNVEAGVRHLKHLLNNFGGDVRLSLAAYNAGEGAVNRNRGVPPYAETQNYVRRITEMYWNQRGRSFTQTGAPVRMYRGEDGVLRMTNTE